MKESFVFLAEGFEEIEALTVVDVLRRAGMPVRTVSISSSLQVVGAHGVCVTADLLFDTTHFTNCGWLILPGGMPGAENLHDYAPLIGLLHQQVNTPGGRVAAICAAPAVVLGEEGLLEGRDATCYPGFESKLKGARHLDVPVTVDDTFVLGNGPASALKWALAIVAAEFDEEKSHSVANGMLLYPRSDRDHDYMFG